MLEVKQPTEIQRAWTPVGLLAGSAEDGAGGIRPVEMGLRSEGLWWRRGASVPVHLP